MSTTNAEFLGVILDNIAGIMKAAKIEGKVEASTSLVRGGVLDSVAVLKLIDGLEQKYGIEFDPSELSADHIDTPEMIATLVARKRGGA